MLGNEKPIFEFTGPFGVPLQVGGSILLLPLIFIGLGGGMASIMYDMIIVSILIGSIFLHELGHAWGCKVQGVPVRRIMIYGGGGFCEQSRSATAHQQELIVAMGPIVNFAIWAVASLTYPTMTPGLLAFSVYMLAQINLFLGIFNMLPVQPLDGGKIFQLILMRFLPAATSTRIAGGVGLVFAALWIPAAIWMFLTIGLVLFFFPSFRLHLQMLRV